MQIGIGVSEDLPVPDQQRLAVAVEQAGFDSLWTNEASGRDALQVCQAWALATTTLRVGVGIVPIWTRTPAQLAMACAALQEVSADRFLLGLGVSHPGTMGPWHDVEVRRPLTAARELLAIQRALFAEGRVDVDGEVLSARFRLDVSPLPPRPTTYLAAMGPGMLALAGEAADGVLLNWSSPDEVERAGARVRESARAAGRAGSEVATYVRVAVDDDRDAARAALAQQVGRYAALPAYASHFERQGLGETVRDLKAAYKQAGAAALPDAIDDGVLRQLGWWGTPADDATGALREYADAGLDHLVARVVVVGDRPDASVRAVVETLPSSL